MPKRTECRVDGKRLGELMEEGSVDRDELAELHKMERHGYVPRVK